MLVFSLLIAISVPQSYAYRTDVFARNHTTNAPSNDRVNFAGSSSIPQRLHGVYATSSTACTTITGYGQWRITIVGSGMRFNRKDDQSDGLLTSYSESADGTEVRISLMVRGEEDDYPLHLNYRVVPGGLEQKGAGSVENWTSLLKCKGNGG